MKNLIGKWPSGLLSFLTAKGGQAPPELGEVVVPTIGLEHFYAARDLEVVSSGYIAGLSGVDTGVNITVPANELWRMYAISYGCTGLAAGNKYVISLLVAPAGGQQVCAKGALTWTSSAAASNYRDGFVWPQPCILMPGSSVGATIAEQPAAGTMSINVQALIQRFAS